MTMFDLIFVETCTEPYLVGLSVRRMLFDSKLAEFSCTNCMYNVLIKMSLQSRSIKY